MTLTAKELRVLAEQTALTALNAYFETTTFDRRSMLNRRRVRIVEAVEKQILHVLAAIERQPVNVALSSVNMATSASGAGIFVSRCCLCDMDFMAPDAARLREKIEEHSKIDCYRVRY